MDENTIAEQLTVTDLIYLRNIIDVASTRGAFRGEELLVVGQTFNKLSSFLEVIEKSVDADQEAESDSDNEKPESITEAE